MAKQLNVALNFTAETGQAKAAIQELQQSLSKIAYAGTQTNIVGNSAQNIREASEAAKQLQYHLNNAYNASTGNFDLSRLDKSLKSSGTNVSQLSQKLLGAGTAGQQAFAQLAQSISMADQPMFRINSKLNEMMVTLKNTARWQISSSILHGFMGTLQHAYGYAQDLNESLNNIRIVTGASTDQMAKFAEQANRSAKALSTTTTEYTNASLIYYQQGLSDAEVKERTDVTIKMANAAGVSAQIVSDQMTAVWNNFDDGSKSLEYYADVMTALGAATASSTDEIAAGLEKFAAVSETVGLSYEYATAALATVTATTRQSADVVGNAFKTLFARIQGLQLGETLDDGTTLNKYSQALEKVGISIFEQNGQMKEMDKILDEMGAKWDTLDKSQQTALAQTVAGVRQYTQLVALMDNWDYFGENLQVALGSEGELQKQADIYAESWEAARDRVAAAAEGIYQNLLDDDFFIAINNGFANLLTGVGEFVKGIGGAKGVITAFGSIFLTNFAHKMPEAVENLKYNIQVLTKGSTDAYIKMAADLKSVIQQQPSSFKTESSKWQIESAADLTTARTKLAQISSTLTEKEKQMAEMNLNLASAQAKEIEEIHRKNEALQQSIQLQQKALEISDSPGEKVKTQMANREDQYRKIWEKARTESIVLANDPNVDNNKIMAANQAASEAAKTFYNYSASMDEAAASANDLGIALLKVYSDDKEKLNNIPLEQVKAYSNEIQKLKEQLSSDKTNQSLFTQTREQLIDVQNKIPDVILKTTGLKDAFAQALQSKNSDELIINLEKLENELKDAGLSAEKLEEVLTALYGKDFRTLVNDTGKLKNGLDNASNSARNFKTLIEQIQPQHIVTGLEAITAAAAGLGNFAMGLSSIKSAFQALSNPDLSGFEKFTTTLTSISMVIPMVISGIKNYATVQTYWNSLMSIGTSKILANNIALIASTNIQNAESMSTAAATARHILKASAIDSEIKVQLKGKTVTLAYALAEAIAEKGSLKAAIAYLVEAEAIEADTAAKLKNLLVTQLLYVKILAIAAIIGGAIWAISALVITQKEANEAIAESVDKYEEEKTKLEDLEKELKSVSNAIDELKNKGTLTLTEAEELARLQEQEASLKRQVALQEQQLENARKIAASEYVKNKDKASQWRDKAPGDNEVHTYMSEDGTYVEEYWGTSEDYLKQYGSGSIDNLTSQQRDFYSQIIREEQLAQAKFQQEYADEFTNSQEGFLSWLEENKSATYAVKSAMAQDHIANTKAFYGKDYEDSVMGSMSSLLETSEKVTGSDIFGGILDGSITSAIQAANLFSSTFKDQLLAAGISVEDYGQYLLDSMTTDLENINISDENIEELKGKLTGEDWLILTKLELTGEESVKEILALIEKNKNKEIEVSVTGKFQDAYNIVKDLQMGDIVSADNYGKLSTGTQGLFKYDAANNGYRLTASGEQAYQMEMQAQQQEFEQRNQEIEQEITEIENTINSIQKILDHKNAADPTLTAYDSEAGSWKENATNTIYRQIAILRAAGNNTEADAYEEKLYGGQFGSDEADQLAALVQQTVAELDGLRNQVEGLQQEQQSNKLSLASGAQNTGELGQLISTYKETDIKDENLTGEDLEYTEEYREGLALIASQYEECEEALEEYNEVINDSKSSTKDIQKATTKLQKALKKVEWDNFTDEALDYAKALSKATNEEEVTDALKGIQKSFKDTMGFDVSMEALEKYQDKFVEWANAGEEASDDIATEIYSLLQLEEAAENPIDVTADISQAGHEINNISGLFDSVKNYIEANGITVSATGQADLSGLVAELLASGKTAAEVAAALRSIGQTQVTFDAFGSGLVTYDIGTYEGLVAFINDLTSFHGGITTGGATPDADAIEEAFGPSGISGSGGGRHSGGGGSGGGGGGSKKPPEKKNDSDKERYHTLINQLEDLQSEYDEISEASDRAFGADKLANMDKEIAKTDELISKQKEYLAAIEENLPKDKAIMVEYYNEVIGGPEMQFDERGNISNYDEIQDAMYKAWNEDYYNLSEEEREAWEEKYEKVEKYIEQYEETYDLLRDEEQALQELINQRLDLLLEEVQYKVELKINIADDSLEMIEFQLNMLEDNAFRAAEAIEYQTQQAEILYSKMQANEQGLRDILSTSDMSVNEIEQLLAGDMSVLQGHTFTEAQIEAIREYKSELLSLSEELQEVREEVQERLIDAFDEWNEELDKGIEKFDHYNSIMENYKNMIDIVGKEYLKIDNTALGDLSQAMVENNINRVTATRDALKALTQTQIEAREAYEAALQRGNENDIQYWEETLDTIGEEVEAAEEEMMQAWEDALQAAADAFEEAVERAIENFEKALLPFGTLDEFSDAYEKQQEVADQYLADYEKIYELSKLNRDINNSIDDTKSIAGKQKLRGLLNDINKLQEEGTQLSEYDLEYLQKTYDLRMAEIALEEAQKAKDTVRLTRDNEGNWSYAYTTNTDAADDAAQKYEDALFAMQELSSEYVDEMSEQLISTSLEMEEALAAVRMEDYASIEEYYKKLDEIQQYYLDRMTYMQDEMQKALDNNKALYEQDWQNYAAATGYKISDNEDFMMSYKDTVLGTLFGSESDIVDFQQRVNEALGDSDSGLIGELLDAYVQWSKNTNDAMNAAGSSSENFAQDMDNAVHGEGGIIDSSDEATEAVNDMAIQMVAGFDTISSAIERWQTQAGDAADAVIEDYLRTVTAYNMLVETLSSNRVNQELAATLASHAAQTSSYSGGSAYKASTNSSGSDNASDTTGSQKETYDASYAAMLRNEMKIAQIDARTSGNSTTYNQASQAYKDYMAKFDTGGYTGEWGPEGRFLMAHEKELILNQNDTKNILNTVQLTRDMLNTIDLNARQASIGLGAMVAGVIKDDNGQVLEQEVHIVAEFPNVTDHNEIEEALNNLINTSSQYANRK